MILWSIHIEPFSTIQYKISLLFYVLIFILAENKHLNQRLWSDSEWNPLNLLNFNDLLDSFSPQLSTDQELLQEKRLIIWF